MIFACFFSSSQPSADSARSKFYCAEPAVVRQDVDIPGNVDLSSGHQGSSQSNTHEHGVLHCETDGEFSGFLPLQDGMSRVYYAVGMKDRNYIQAVERAMKVLEAFNHQADASLTGLARRTGLLKSTVFRVLHTLCELKYVERQADGRYRITGRLGQLAADWQPRRELIRLAAPLMGPLLSRFRETVNLGVLDEGEVLYVHVLESPHPFRLAAHAGMRSPAHSTALGKCLLSTVPSKQLDAILEAHPLEPLTPRTVRDRASLERELKRVRERGYAIDNGEDSEGARCVAAPIYEESGQVIAALSISGPASRVHPGRDREMAKALMDVARRISGMLRYTANGGRK
jgi:DNA-binding IclR family transcriptional regulator